MNKSKGITLIVLVITIIVLLIFAGVSIASLTGENGILTQANKAKAEITIGEEKEAIGLAYNGAKVEKDGESVEAKDLNNQFLKNGTNATASGTKKINITFHNTNRRYIIDSDGKITEKEVIDWDTIIADANKNPEKYKSSEQQTSSYIGIGTNGGTVNMDLWSCATIDDNAHYSLRRDEYLGAGCWSITNAYLGSDFDNIIIPQYIKGEEDEYFKEVTALVGTFTDCKSLITAPEIPSSVTNMVSTFYGCTSLTIAPEIPSSVTNMAATFSNCTSLTIVPEISSNVTNMDSTFDRCTSLTIAPEIPLSVTDMASTFFNCTSLTIAPTIPTGVTNMAGTFKGCTSLTTVQEIPSRVNDMTATFKGCTSLTGIITINANPTVYDGSSGGCFEDTINPINLIGDSTILQELANTANNGNVEVLKK